MVPLAASAVATPGPATASTLAGALPDVQNALNSEEEAQSSVSESGSSKSTSTSTPSNVIDITITTTATQSIGLWSVELNSLLPTILDAYGGGLSYAGADASIFSGTEISTAPVLSTPLVSASPTPTGNPGGTNIHIKSGCASVNGSPRCVSSPPYNVAYQGAFNSTADIYSSFNSQDGSDQNVTPGCGLKAVWPYNYGDIYLEEDNCLYDSSGNKIFDQCCTASTTAKVSNPYYNNPAGFYIEALKCDNNCDDALEIVPYSKNTCSQIASNQIPWWGAAFLPSEGTTDLTDSNQIEPFSLLNTMDSNSEIIIYFVYSSDPDDIFQSDPCGIKELNITLSKTTSGGYNWSNTDNHSGICQDVSSTSATTCSLNSEDYTAQELLYCVDPLVPNYCSA